jgi:predicted esterase
LYDGNPEPFKTTLFRSGAWLAEQVAAFERAHGLRPARRALLGYSQGAYFAYPTALARQDLFDTLIAVAGGRIRTEFVERELASPGRLRTLILHGTDDRAVSADLSREAAETLRAAGYAVDLELLPGGHGLRADRDATATRWLAARWGLPLPDGLA